MGYEGGCNKQGLRESDRDCMTWIWATVLDRSRVQKLNGSRVYRRRWWTADCGMCRPHQSPLRESSNRNRALSECMRRIMRLVLMERTSWLRGFATSTPLDVDRV